jgi:hypothetical protein
MIGHVASESRVPEFRSYYICESSKIAVPSRRERRYIRLAEYRRHHRNFVMKNHTYLYILMLAVAGTGLWAIIKAGSRLQAAAHLEGDWAFEGDHIGPTTDGPDHLGKGFHLDQSGQFVRLRFDQGEELSLRARTMPQGVVGASPAPIELADGTWELKGTVWSDGGQLRGAFNLNGPRKARFTATRITTQLTDTTDRPPAGRQTQAKPPVLPPPLTASDATPVLAISQASPALS